MDDQILKRVLFGLLVGLILIAAGLAITAQPESLPIFDTHVHYNKDVWDIYSTEEIIEKMKTANVMRALVSSSPDDGTRMLFKLDTHRVVPFLRPYHDDVTRNNWFKKDQLLAYLKNRLDTTIYAGIGEIHLYFDGTAGTPIVRKTVRMAVERDLFLHLHSNAVVVQTILEYEPDIKILWAHAGMTETPEKVANMLDRYHRLWVEISDRELEIAPGGTLDPDWRALFIRHPDRITIGSDTWIAARWDGYRQILDFDRHWLGQLPLDVAKKIAYANALKLFGAN